MHLRSRTHDLLVRLGGLARAIQEDDEALVEQIVILSRSRRLFAPLAFTVGAFAMLFQGLKLLLSNWRLMLVQVPPAVWIWLAMFDLKARVLYGRSFPTLRGWILLPIAFSIVAITVACFFLNAVFAFAIADSRVPKIRPAYLLARKHLGPILLWGAGVGILLAVGTTVAPRWGKPWFVLCLGIVIGIMMIAYVAVPARLIGIKPKRSPREKLTAGALGATLGATVCTPPYLLGRLGILMLGSKYLFIPGIVALVFGFTLQAGATGAVRAIKMSLKLAVEPAPPAIATGGSVGEPTSTAEPAKRSQSQ
ncbi:MAG: hypothetical protein WBV85_01525 [Solirubrobacteraceae bacterium]